MKKSESFYVVSIFLALNRIQIYTKGVTAKKFKKNLLLQDGVYRQLEIVGEAASKLNRITRKKIGELPWNDIVALRNRFIHEYFGVDIETVWVILSEDLPPLRAAIESYLDSEPGLQKFLKIK